MPERRGQKPSAERAQKKNPAAAFVTAWQASCAEPGEKCLVGLVAEVVAFVGIYRRV